MSTFLTIISMAVVLRISGAVWEQGLSLRNQSPPDFVQTDGGEARKCLLSDRIHQHMMKDTCCASSPRQQLRLSGATVYLSFASCSAFHFSQKKRLSLNNTLKLQSVHLHLSPQRCLLFFCLLYSSQNVDQLHQGFLKVMSGSPASPCALQNKFASGVVLSLKTLLLQSRSSTLVILFSEHCMKKRSQHWDNKR